MSKATTTLLIILTLLLCSSTLKTYAARPNPASPEVATALTKPQHKDVEEAGAGEHGEVVGEEKCEEGMEEEECLMRRTLLVAHLDYIYTQSKNP